MSKANVLAGGFFLYVFEIIFIYFGG